MAGVSGPFVGVGTPGSWVGAWGVCRRACNHRRRHRRRPRTARPANTQPVTSPTPHPARLSSVPAPVTGTGAEVTAAVTAAAPLGSPTPSTAAGSAVATSAAPRTLSGVDPCVTTPAPARLVPPAFAAAAADRRNLRFCASHRSHRRWYARSTSAIFTVAFWYCWASMSWAMARSSSRARKLAACSSW